MKVLLLSEQRLKEDSLINNNVDSMYIFPAIQTAQEIGLQPLLGTKLYNKLLNVVENGGDELYFDLLDSYVIPYLEMKVMADIQIPLAYKIRNAGLVQNTSENTTLPTLQETQYIVDYYENKANFYANRMSDYLIANSNKYPEYYSCDSIADMHSNRMSYNTGIYLGGC